MQRLGYFDNVQNVKEKKVLRGNEEGLELFYKLDAPDVYE